jgi:hypothetical protein
MPHPFHARRAFLASSTLALGSIALASLFAPRAAARRLAAGPRVGGRAKRVIFLFMSGGPSQVDLFDPKPLLAEREGTELPDSVRNGQRITTMTSGQGALRLVGASHGFRRSGASGVELSELLPHLGSVADRITLVRSMHTEPINHDPAATLVCTGHELAGRPSFGSWASYGLGSAAADLPAFVVLLSGEGGQPLQSRYWRAGFLPAAHHGVALRAGNEPLLYAAHPPGVDAAAQRAAIDALRELDRLGGATTGDPEVAARIEAAELAFRMQASVPELADLAREPAHVLEAYGAAPGAPSFAANCVLARRLVERGVRFVQLCHRDWDHHQDLPRELVKQCNTVDQPAAALLRDLDERGLLDETLVVFAGEFGRTPYSQGPPSRASFGRDHHPRCFSIWLAGGGLRRGHVHGATDEFGYNVVEGALHVHDLHATVLAALGLDHEALTWRFQGRDFRLTDVSGRVAEELFA